VSAASVTHTTARPGDPVTIEYHDEPGVAVPRAGTRGANACEPIRAAGLTCNLTRRAATSPVAPDQVLDQNPTPGTRVGEGSTVNVVADSHSFATLYRHTTPSDDDWSLRLSTSSTPPAGWISRPLGVVFTEQAPGSQALYCWEPNGVGDNQSNVYYDAAGEGVIGAYHRRCSERITAYIPTSESPGTTAITYVWTGNSDHYYSVDQNDPAGARYLRRQPSTGPQSFFFLW
jgi:hypothetical protein